MASGFSNNRPFFFFWTSSTFLALLHKSRTRAQNPPTGLERAAIGSDSRRHATHITREYVSTATVLVCVSRQHSHGTQTANVNTGQNIMPAYSDYAEHQKTGLPPDHVGTAFGTYCGYAERLIILEKIPFTMPLFIKMIKL